MLAGEVALEAFDVKIGLRGSVLSQLLSIIAILDLTNRKTIMKDAMNTHTPLCGRPGTGGEWQTGATGDTVGYQTLSET